MAFAVEDQPPGRGNGEAHRAGISIGEDGGSGGGLFGLFILGFSFLGNCQSAEEGQDASDDHPLHETENSSFSVIYQSHSRGFPRIASTISLGRKIDSVVRLVSGLCLKRIHWNSSFPRVPTATLR